MSSAAGAVAYDDRADSPHRSPYQQRGSWGLLRQVPLQQRHRGGAVLDSIREKMALWKSRFL